MTIGAVRPGSGPIETGSTTTRSSWWPVYRLPRRRGQRSTSAVGRADIELLAHRYAGRKGIARARQAIELFDPGSQSPKESWLRVVLIQAGLRRPQTQIPVLNGSGDVVAYLDLGWEDVKVAVEYDGEQHRHDRRQYTWDIRRLEMLERLGWIVIRVVAGDRPAAVVERVRAALARRVCA
jgi:very-short-patch-repair endonuclease